MKKNLFFITVILLNVYVNYSQTWTPINSPTHLRIRDCSFIDQDNGWIITADSIYKTQNGGAAWVSQNYPPDPPSDIRSFNSIHFINPNVGVIGCGNYLYNGANPALVSNILWTNDGGNNWIYKDLGTENDWIEDAILTSSLTAYATSQYGTATKTTDGGMTWTDISQISPYAGNKLFHINSDTLYFASSDDVNTHAAFGKIINNTLKAATVLPNSPYSSFNAIYFFNYLNRWLGGRNGDLVSTTDAGQNWTVVTSGVSSDINDICFVNKSDGWFTTSDGKILHSNNSGKNWNIEYNGTSALYSLCFTKPNGTGYAVGDSGKILKYINTLGIHSLDKLIGISASPNPGRGKITIDFDANSLNGLQLTIFNSCGQKIIETENVSQRTIDLHCENLSNGIYFIQLTDKEKLIGLGKFVLTD